MSSHKQSGKGFLLDIPHQGVFSLIASQKDFFFTVSSEKGDATIWTAHPYLSAFFNLGKEFFLGKLLRSHLLLVLQLLLTLIACLAAKDKVRPAHPPVARVKSTIAFMLRVVALRLLLNFKLLGRVLIILFQSGSACPPCS